MALKPALVDTSFIYALFDKSDRQHARTRRILDSQKVELIIPDVVLGEVIYLLKDRVGIAAATLCLNSLAAARIPLEPIGLDDLPRIGEIMTTYASARFDFVDCCIMTLAERLNITQIYTFDQRDFSIFRPRHTTHLELLPE